MNKPFRPYPKYVYADNAPWLPDIPAHWSIVSNRSIFTETDQDNHPDETMLSVTISKGVIPQSELHDPTEQTERSLSTRSYHKLVEPNDIVYNKMRAWQGAIGLSEYRGIISPDYVVERPSEGIYPRYFHYLFRTPEFAAETQRWSYGIASDRWRLRHRHFKAIRTCLPPLEEQAAIVRYLDHAEQLITRYIGAKERLIALLEEQRQAVIRQAVTRGLDPNISLKQSGIPQLAEIPVKWETRRLKAVVDNIADQAYARAADEIYIALENVQSWTGLYREAGPDITFESTVRRFRPHDVLFGKLRPYLAKVASPDRKGVCVGEFLVLRPKRRYITNRYLELLLVTKPNIDAITASTFGAKMPRADWQFIGNMVQPCPPIAEQNAIADHVDSTTWDIRQATAKTRQQIDLIQEYRARLITDVVTGQTDVRDAKAAIPS